MTIFIETLNHWGDQFLKFAWPILWQSSLLITIIFVLEFSLRRKIRAAIRYALWLMVLVKLLLPPSLALPTSPSWWIHPSVPPPAKAPPVSFTVSYGEQMTPDFPLPPSPVIPPPRAPAMSFAAWALAASGVVSAGLLAWLLVRWRQINQKVRRATASEELIPVLDEARHLTRLRPGIRLKLTEDSMSPAVCGLFRPVVLLPQSLVEKLSAGQLRAVLLHEAIHLRRGDVWVNCAQALLQIVYWWHPLLWLANARIRRVREEAVDDAVMLALCDDAEIYAPTLLEVARLAFNRPLASLGLVGILESRSALRQRIERLMDFNAPRQAGLTVVSIFGILAFSAIALPMGQAPEQTNAPMASASNSTIYTNAPQNVLKASMGTNTVRGLLSDTNFRVVLHALEQRTGTETLAEPEPVTTAGRGANQINRMVVPDKIDIPTITTNAAESTKLVQDGKLLYEMGKFEDAEAKLSQVLKLDPDNQRAVYYLNLVRQADYTRKDSNRTNQTANSIVEVPKVWSPKVGIGSPVPNPYGTNNDIHISLGREMIYRKLNQIHLESVSWSNSLPLSEVIRYLAEQSRLRDPDKKGINFIYNPSEAAGTAAGAPNLINPATGLPEKPAAGAAPDAVDASTINVKLMLNNASVHDVLDAVVLVADHPIRYTVEDYAVVISPKPSGPEPPMLEMRAFRADSQFFVSNLITTPGVQSNNIATMAESLFSKRGVDLTAPGRSIAYNDKLGLLFVRATASEIDTVERAIWALNQLNPQIHIKARFIEVPKKGFVMPQLSTNTVAGQMTGILSDPEFRTVLQALEHRQGVEILAMPEAVTSSGRQTQMRATDTVVVLTNYAFHADTYPVVSPQMGKFEIGPTMDVVPWVLSDGYTIDLTTIVSQFRFIGYDQVTNEVFATNSIGKVFHVPTVSPRFRIQQANATVNLWDGQTLVLGNLKSQFVGAKFVGANGEIRNESKFLQDAEKKNGTADKELLVFITAWIVDPAGNRVHSDAEMRQIQEKTKNYAPPQPQISSPSR